MAKNDEEKNQPSLDIALVLGYIATKDLASNDDKIELLIRLGYSNAQMVRVCGLSDKTVANIKSQLKKGK